MNKITLLIIVFFLFAGNIISQTMNRNITVDGTNRKYILHIPETNTLIYKLPLLIVLHGHGGNGKQIMKETGFNEISDRERFIAVYPYGINKGWNDGREISTESTKYDDVKFISRIIDTTFAEFEIDTSRIFVTGMSNGGFLSIYLAYKLNSRILAAAPVCANIPERIKDEYTFAKPVSVMLINGTEDPLVKYEGGKVGFGLTKGRGYSISTDETVKIFVSLDKCNPVPVTEEIPDKDEEDDCYAQKYIYKGGNGNTDVVLVKVINGGHSYPGGTQYLPKFIVGNICMDFKASELIWKFFNSRKGR
ncbi:MAG: PHB depolymerase family esterase [Ignavibacteria bacterium]|nr:PHB depolymerase family esterase [Ignavibacteria bacterium]